VTSSSQTLRTALLRQNLSAFAFIKEYALSFTLYILNLDS
jgi:hypothetical protein